MTKQVEINGVIFFPIKEAASRFSYSKDYIARLAREQKIVATQIGRQWFIDMTSLQNFSEASELEQTIRKQKLSEERKREQELKKRVTEIKHLATTKTAARSRRSRHLAGAVMALGLVFGIFAYTNSFFVTPTLSTIVYQDQSAAAAPATSYATKTANANDVAQADLALALPQPTAVLTTTMEQPLFVDESEVRSLTEGDVRGVFLLGAGESLASAAAIEASFSDDVAVEYVDEHSGVVSYADAEGEVVQYQFVSVPRAESAVGKSTPEDVQ